MSKLITHIKRLALALCLATPIVSWAATTYSTDYSVTGSETAYTSSAGNANVYWQNFNFRAAVDKDNLEHGYYFFLKDGDTDIGETDVAVKLDSITLTWGNNTDSFGADDTPYLVVTTPDDNSPVIIGVSDAGDKRVANGTSTFPFSNVVLASNAKYRFYFYKNDVSSLSVGTVLTGAQQARINGRWHNTQGDARADYNDIRCSGGTGYSINCSFVVSPLEEGDAVVLETSDASIPLAAADTPVVVEGKVVDGAVDVGSEVAVDGVLTVCGEATTLVLTDSLTATAFYFPATVTIDASAVSGLDPTGDDSSKTTTLLSGALKYMTAPTVVLPAATAGMIYETNVTASGISVTVVKGVDCVETITANTVWSDIKPEGWIDSVVGDKPSIEITYEGEEPVTLTFDEVVTAGTLTLTGNIVVEASAAATFGTVSAGAGSVVEMANMTITTQSGAGTYRYRSSYPIGVPQNKVYEYVGGTSESPVVVSDAFDVYGYLKLSGFFRFADYAMSPVGTLDVLSGKVNVNCSGTYLKGVITIRDDAEFVNEKATDALGYGDSTTVNVYGTLTMGNTRWTVGNNNTINVYGGAITGAGDGNNGALDFIGSSVMNAYADSTVSAAIRFRNALTPVTVAQNVTLTLENIKQGFDAGGVTKKGAGTLKFTSNPALQGGITVEAGTLAFDTESDVDRVVTYTASALNSANMDYINASNWKGTVVISAVAAGNTATQVALNKTSQANQDSYLTLNEISGNAWCANDDYTVQPAITLAGDVNFENGYSGKTVTFRKIAAGSGNLSLKRWSSCTGITYGFTTLDADNYTGTIQLDGSVLTFNVGDILKANAQPGDKVLPLTVANNATVNLSGAKVNGEAADLEVKEDGIYIAVPVVNVTVTVPAVPNTTVNVVSSEGDVVDNGDGTYTVLDGSTVTVTYSSADYEVTGGTFEFTASEGYTVDTTGVTTAPYVAQIKVGTEYEKYTSVAQALTSENVYRGITLLGNATEGTLDITQQYVMLTGAGYTLTADITVGASTTFVPYNVTLDGDLTVNGVYNQMGAVAVTGDLTTGDGARLQFSTLGTDVAALTVGGDIAVNGALTLTPNSTSGLTTGVAYKTLNGATVTLAEGASVTLGTIEGAILGYVVEPNETTTLTIKIPAAKVGEDDYHDTFASARAAAAGVGVITLLKDVSSVVTNYNTQTGHIISIVTNDLVTIAADEVLKINANGYVICVGLASGLTPPVYTLSTVTDGNVATYSVVHSVASVDNELYPSLAAAIEAAEAGDTITLLANDRVSFADGGQIFIDKALTIDGAGYTIYGKSEWTAEEINAVRDGKGADPTLVHGIKVVGSGAVTIKNVKFTEFADVTYCNGGCAYAVFTPDTYTGTLTLDSVQIDKFNRTAIDIRGGTFEITNCVVTCNAVGKGADFLVFQQPIQFLGDATGRVIDTTVTGFCANFPAGTDPDEIYDAGGIVSWSSGAVAVVGCTVTTTDAETFGIETDGTGKVTVSGTTVSAGSSVGYWGDGTSVVINSGVFTGELYGSGEGSLIVYGGTFDEDPSDYVAAGYAATESAGVWTVTEKKGIDPTDPTSSQEVTPSAAEIEEAGGAEEAAIAKAEVTVPEAVSSAVESAAQTAGTTAEELYKSYFKLQATETSEGSGVYTVTIVDIADDVKEEVAETAAEAIATNDVDGDGKVTVTVKPGLYYGFDANEELGSLVEPTLELATGTSIKIPKPGTTKGFIKVKIGTSAN